MADYNGWTNYATWRVNLEVFDGYDIEETFRRKPQVLDLMIWAEEYANELLELEAKQGLALDYARAFISEVNWHEIAKHLLEGAYEEEEEEDMA
jgi:hypothetical protein